jgi:hypothetical protein
MHSFHQSRGRVLFEVFCALAVSASLVGAWMQTGASALLPAAIVALLYGLVHLFDMAGRESRTVAQPQRIPFAPEEAGEEAVNADLPVPQESEDRPAKAPRKGKARSASAAKKAKIVELVPPEEMEAAEPAYSDDVAHFPLEPLFEPVPAVRQQRTVFGRKAG